MDIFELLRDAGYSMAPWSGGGFLANAPGPPGEQLIGWYGHEYSALGACSHHHAETKKLEKKKEKQNATSTG